MVLKRIDNICDDNMNVLNSGALLQDLLLEARTDSRLTCGFYNAAQVMENYLVKKTFGYICTLLLAFLKAERRVQMYPKVFFTKSPSSVLLCILPQNHLDDAETHIHSVLIEAFCFDNNISLIKVDSEEKLSGLIAGARNRFFFSHNTPDFRCVLVKHPEGSWSKCVENFIQYYKKTYKAAYPHQIIKLPG